MNYINKGRIALVTILLVILFAPASHADSYNAQSHDIYTKQNDIEFEEWYKKTYGDTKMQPLSSSAKLRYKCMLNELPGIPTNSIALAAVSKCEEISIGYGWNPLHWVSYSSSRDCIIEKSKNTLSNIALTHIRVACSSLFPSK